ncbi:hypothetical protein GKZ89_02165 [Bacillus mangrovi]|uniref:YpfB family protein n=1 Tax=Metabacillus mangrovi TaxID=1491830 RepID=A0A7X2S2S5_9BACI|nr:DUF5359 family protein [Metabacillus mangrovi]MTH52195.1 hypothetical protein [Metabacillus mangrovi]
MKRAEKLVWGLIIFHLAVLIAAQAVLQHTGIKPYLSKAIRYEGVNRMTVPEWLETFK